MKLVSKIIRESIKILIITSILSSVGGISLEYSQDKLIAMLPFLILFPALNSLIGNFGIIFSSRLTTLLYLGKTKKNILNTKEIRELITIILLIAIISTTYITIIASIVAIFKGFNFNLITFLKILIIAVSISLSLLILLVFISTKIGIYLFKKRKDPDNFLTPIATSIADIGSMLMISLSLYFFF